MRNIPSSLSLAKKVSALTRASAFSFALLLFSVITGFAQCGKDVVLTHAFWQRRFGADPSVIGRAIQLDTMPFTIVGVMPAGFSGIEVDGPC